MLAVRHGDDEIAMVSNSATCAVHLQIFATGPVRVLVASYVVVGARDWVRGAILRVAPGARELSLRRVGLRALWASSSCILRDSIPRAQRWATMKQREMLHAHRRHGRRVGGERRRRALHKGRRLMR